MKTKSLILLAIFSMFILSCDKDMKRLNAADEKADTAEIAKICESNGYKCGKAATNYGGVSFEIDCGKCSDGYECRYNNCWDIDECADPSLNNCNNEVSTCANEEGTYSCICKENYSGDNCVPDTRTKECEELPENAEWNSVSEITQTWNGSEWTPSTRSEYNETASEKGCRFKCISDYHWEDSACVFNTKTNVECTGLPEHASWNIVSEITQTWNGNDWEPSTTGTYNEETSNNECRFKCNENYSWKNTECIADTRKVAECAAKPDHTEWNDNGAEGKFTQTWDGSQWSPTSHISSHNIETGECCYKCNANYYWNDSKCVSPCESDPCAKVVNSPNECTASAWNEYSCACNNVYTWNGSACIVPLGNICTGQTKCYDSGKEILCPSSENDDFYGQDAQYAKLGYCIPQSFSIKTIVAGQNIVVDNNTGLEWQQVISEDSFTWEDAITHCENLNYGGYTDWRLPDPLELLTIVDNNIYAPAVNTTYFPNTPNTYFNTSTNHANPSITNVWAFDHNQGFVDNFSIDGSRRVRCVRGQELAIASFTTSSDGYTVTDSTTGLMWQKTYETGKTWQEALAYCQSLNTEGYGGYSTEWRLPNKNEIASLVNYGKVSPASDFPDIPPSSDSNWFWSSSSTSSSPNNVWRLYFPNGAVRENTNKTGTTNVLCVRSEKINDPCENHICGSVAHSSGICVPKNAFEYSCACDEGYFWDGEECVNPCENNHHCESETHSSGICVPKNAFEYSCACDDGYFWDGEECVNPCDTYPCSTVTNSTNVCTSLSLENYSCGCQTHYTWNSSTLKCDADKQIASCTELPENAEWNTVFEIEQIWNGEYWNPSTTGMYNEETSSSECRFKCKTNYSWKDSTCKADSRNQNCTGLPTNAEWNTVSKITQTWNGSSWQPSTTGTYNTEASLYECRFKCKTGGYRWDGLKCSIPECSSSSGTPCKIGDLMWSGISPTSLQWNDAVSYCDTLTESGYSDWRMPTINELRGTIKNCSYTMPGGSCGIKDSCLSNDNCYTSSCQGCNDTSHCSTDYCNIFGELDYLWSSSVRNDGSDRPWLVLGSKVLSRAKDTSYIDVRCVRK